MDNVSSANRREFARVEVEATAQLMPVEPGEVEAIRSTILSQSSVWAPSDIATLRMMANGSQSRESSLIARALVEISREIARLRQVCDSEAWNERSVDATLECLSGSGGQLGTPAPLQRDEILLMRVLADDDGMPPIQCLIRIVAPGLEAGRSGFSFEAIHPEDQDRLVRHVFRLQRKELRDAARES